MSEAPPRGASNPLSEALPRGLQDTTTPVLFLHGVGGLMLYLELLKHVIGLGHPLVVVEYKHVGLRLRWVFGGGGVVGEWRGEGGGEGWGGG